MVTRRTLLTAAGAALASPSRATAAESRRRTEPPAREQLFELRSYATQPARRDELVTMFESVFLDAYERGGTRVLGTFTTPDDPDRWIWVRAFPDAAARGIALANFYGSTDWREHADAANATIADTSDVLMLRCVAGAVASDAPTPGMLECRVQVVEPRGEVRFARRWLELAVPLLRTLGAEPFAVLATDRRANTYPRQPIRDDSVVVTFTRFESLEAHVAALERCARDADWCDRIEPAFASARRGPPEIRRLLPTSRSRLR